MSEKLTELGYLIEGIEAFQAEVDNYTLWLSDEGSIDECRMYEYLVTVQEGAMEKETFCLEVGEARKYQVTSCSHEWDCCGCWFRSSVNIVQEDNSIYSDAKTTSRFTVRERWARNY